jgi:hypothetical protein
MVRKDISILLPSGVMGATRDIGGKRTLEFGVENLKTES